MEANTRNSASKHNLLDIEKHVLDPTTPVVSWYALLFRWIAATVQGMYGSYMAPWSTLKVEKYMDESWSQTIYTLTRARGHGKAKVIGLFETSRTSHWADRCDRCMYFPLF